MPAGSLLDRIPPRSRSTPPAHEPVAERQSGVIPFSIVGSVPAFLLVTSRRSGRWIFPKGKLAEGLQPWESAAREAREEAGVEGEVSAEPVGSYRSWKMRGIRRTVIEVEMYPLRVERQLEKWREKGERYRHWVTLPEARRLVSQKPLVELIEIVDARARAGSLTGTQKPAASRIAQ